MILGDLDRKTLRPRRIRTKCAGPVEHHFCAPEAVESAGVAPVGPRSNTGQKSTPRATNGAIVDALTVVVSRSILMEHGVDRPALLLHNLFGIGANDARITDLQARRWIHYAESSVIVDANGEVVGKYGQGGNGDTVCLSLMGQGCKLIRNWDRVEKKLAFHRARITRCDLAYDDYDGHFGGIREHEARALEGAFAGNGAPPTTSFHDDHGTGKGSTLYVGKKGHKQACIYEKGKQLGMPESPWVRYEVRLYSKHAVIPLAALRYPMRFLRGGYGYLGQLFVGIADGMACKLESTKRYVEATGFAMSKWLRRQCGPALFQLSRALGEDLPEFVRDVVSREGLPARFKRVCTEAELPAFLRDTLRPLEADYSHLLPA